MSSNFYSDSIFWIEVDKIKPNPYQPRHEFDEARLKDLAESIRMYGILQPLIVTRKEIYKEDGGLAVEYELVSGERRLRASKLAGLLQVPTLIRASEDDARVKLELALIENVQREDLNPVDRAMAFDRLVKEFNFKHFQIAEKIGKSREYVTNSIRLLALPENIIDSLHAGQMSEAPARPLLMLIDRPEEQAVLFKDIILKKLTVREAERAARSIAVEKQRKRMNALPDQEIQDMISKFTETLGTRVEIEQKRSGGKIMIDFFTADDLHHIYDLLKKGPSAQMINEVAPNSVELPTTPTAPTTPIDDRAPADIKIEESDDELYSIKNFSL